ncbi:MAG: alpha/beta hydrolase [Clostridiales bacterium]|nr:alpha/beta hydrolase [Clostridiales bacterium]
MLRGTTEQFHIDGRGCSVYLPPEYSSECRYPVAFLNGTDELTEIIAALEPHIGNDCVPFLLVNVESADWNGDMTPWPAPALFKRSGPFGGRAGAYLDTLAHEVKPYVDKHYCTKPEPENTALAGYSLGGLAALYALYTHRVFGRIGCLSGSLWYESWLGYMELHQPQNPGATVYMSLGTKEKESKNARMAAVGDCTEKALEILKGQLSREESLKFEWNDGGHFTEIPRRFSRALVWLMKK